jgi:hypothetical protein
MRSAVAGAVPGLSACRGPGVRHRALAGPCGLGAGRAARPGACAAGPGEYRAAAAGAVSGAVRALVCGLCCCGMGLSLSGYLVSERVT